ncbi:MAG: thiamine pyrophosphate-dependent dehydrogenase E1 component subunit alpha [Candidatus Niyogibacteria bacterium]|nr:MAG: thiamine pyrophosphate-dependent dehydrogenase E1 component subunit alpha [Candidatus Niyogibacteria bacterium]
MTPTAGKIKPFFKEFDYLEDLKEHFIEVAGPNQIYLREKSELMELAPKDTETLLFLLRSMLITRRAEEKVRKLWPKEIPGSIFFGRGNEATSCGVTAAICYEDPLFPLHRDLGCDFVRGAGAFRREDIPVNLAKLYFAQHMSKKDSPCRGRDGNIHWGIPTMNRYPMISHLGTNIPIAGGAALAEKTKKSGLVAVTFLGDGATSASDFQAPNQAAAWKLPLIVIIDNNQWAYRTTLKEQTEAIPLSRKAEAFGIHGFTVDGTDILTVYAVTKKAHEIALGGRPVLIESVTYRMAGHSEYDPFQKYVPKEDLDRWHRRDPIARLTNSIYGEPSLTEENIEDFDRKLREIKTRLEKEMNIEQELDEAIEWARNLPDPEPSDSYGGIFANPTAQNFLDNLPKDWRR